jgi:hypothetical protein
MVVEGFDPDDVLSSFGLSIAVDDFMVVFVDRWWWRDSIVMMFDRALGYRSRSIG